MELKDIRIQQEFEEAKRALELYKQGYRLREISKIMSLTRKISHETVRIRLKAIMKDIK